MTIEAVATPDLQRRTLQCPCCGSQHVARSFNKGGIDYYACSSCSLTFIFPCPDDVALQAHYEDYGRRYYSVDGLKQFLLSSTHYRREVQLLVRIASGGTLLDVGCSVGGFVKAAGELGFIAEGIDISLPSVTVGREAGLKIQAGDFLHKDFSTTFDIITMWATLEHLPLPNRYVERARELLRPGGLLLASVPNFSGITQHLIGTKDRYVGIDHLNYWTARGFASYLQGFGFEVLEVVTSGFNPITLIKDWLGSQNPVDCEQMAVEQKQVASIKGTCLTHVQRTVERVLNLGLLGDSVAVACRLRT